MVVVAAVAVAAFAGVLLWPKRAAAAPPEQPPGSTSTPPVETAEGSAEQASPTPVSAPQPPIDLSVLAKAGEGAAVAAIGALGTVAGGIIADFTDPGGQNAPITHAALPVIGGVVAGGLALAAGPQAVIVIPALVIIAAVNDIGRAIEQLLRSKEDSRLRAMRDEAIAARDFYRFWGIVEKARADGYDGLEVYGSHLVPDYIPLVEPMKDSTGTMVNAFETRPQLAWAYSTAPDVPGGAPLTPDAARARGDLWADQLGAGLPWLSPTGTRSLRPWAQAQGLRGKSSAEIAQERELAAAFRAEGGLEDIRGIPTPAPKPKYTDEQFAAYSRASGIPVSTLKANPAMMSSPRPGVAPAAQPTPAPPAPKPQALPVTSQPKGAVKAITAPEYKRENYRSAATSGRRTE